MALIYKIHPAIGVARVGNSPNEFFFGPEHEDEVLNPPGGFKDAECRLKRQAARFYIYEHDTVASTANEVTGAIASITWRFTPACGKLGGGIRTFEDAEITGRLAFDDFAMSIHSGAATPDTVPLGELRSDDQGRLIFLGGFGAANPIPGAGTHPPLTVLSSGWYDDICEGPIEAEFDFEGEHYVLHAWALVAPPRSSPQTPPSAPSIYSVIVDAATTAGWEVPPATPGATDALDKAPLHFVSGVYPGIEMSLTHLLGGYTSSFEEDDPLRFKPSVTPPRLTLELPNPWQVDILSCGWAVWSGDFDSVEDARLHWAEAGILVNTPDGPVITEQCDAALNITLVTPSLTFGQVPQGPDMMSSTALRAIVFEVISTAPGVAFAYDVPPAAPFEVEGPMPGPVGPTGSTPAIVRLWIRYTTTTAPSDDATVVVHHLGTSTTWTIPLYAETVARRVTATAVVLDRSGSMAGTSGSASAKHEIMRQAAMAFLDLALPGDFIQLVRYDDTAQAIPLDDTDGVSGSAVTELDASTRETLKSLVAGPDFDPHGSTSIGIGIQTGQGRLDAVPADPDTGELPHKAMLILTDGMENTPPLVNNVASLVNATTYAVGLGTPANTSAPVLQALSGNHGGYLLVTGDITGDNQFLLEKYFLQILAGINHAEVALDPDGVLMPNHEQAVPFRISDLDAGFEAILVTTAPQFVDFRIVSPAGRVLEPHRALAEPGLTFGLSSRVAFYRIALPAEIQPSVIEKAGTWHALLKIGRPRLKDARASEVPPALGYATTDPELLASRKQLLENTTKGPRHVGTKGGLPFTFLVHTYSSASLRAFVHQTSFEPGAQVTIHASLLHGGELPLGRAELIAEITRPDGAKSNLHLEHVKGEPGRYHGSYAASVPGVYACRVRARAITCAGHALTRECALTAAVWYGGDRDAREPAGDSNVASRDSCCSGLLACLIGEHGGLSPRVRDKLRRLGVDLQKLEECALEARRQSSGTAELSRELERGDVQKSTRSP